MSYLKIQTNKSIRKRVAKGIMETAAELVAVELGKPRELVMVAVQPDTLMHFAGSDEPVAFLELKCVGVPRRKMKQLCAGLSSLVENELGVGAGRVYVKIIDVPHGMWGWGGGRS